MPELYRRWISPLLHAIGGQSGACRFYPTCSEYAATAVAHHGLLRGSGLAVWRLLRCQPFARGGFDPVPGTYSSDTASADSSSSIRTDATLHLP